MLDWKNLLIDKQPILRIRRKRERNKKNSKRRSLRKASNWKLEHRDIARLKTRESSPRSETSTKSATRKSKIRKLRMTKRGSKSEKKPMNYSNRSKSRWMRAWRKSRVSSRQLKPRSKGLWKGKYHYQNWREDRLKTTFPRIKSQVLQQKNQKQRKGHLDLTANLFNPN